MERYQQYKSNVNQYNNMYTLCTIDIKIIKSCYKIFSKYMVYMIIRLYCRQLRRCGIGWVWNLFQTYVHLCPSFHVVCNTGFPIINLASVHE